jgi:hypothetical protein
MNENDQVDKQTCMYIKFLPAMLISKNTTTFPLARASFKGAFILS